MIVASRCSIGKGKIVSDLWCRGVVPGRRDRSTVPSISYLLSLPSALPVLNSLPSSFLPVFHSSNPFPSIPGLSFRFLLSLLYSFLPFLYSRLLLCLFSFLSFYIAPSFLSLPFINPFPFLTHPIRSLPCLSVLRSFLLFLFFPASMHLLPSCLSFHPLVHIARLCC